MKANRSNPFAKALAGSGEVLRRCLVLVLVALWFGGFTFYASVVIHSSGPKVFADHRAIGFLTQEVTRWLNFLGVLTLLALLWNALAVWPEDRRWLRWGLSGSWLVMIVTLVMLYGLHGTMDQMLDLPNRRIHDKPHFHELHETYEMVATTQWLAMLLHLWCMVATWRHFDRTEHE